MQARIYARTVSTHRSEYRPEQAAADFGSVDGESEEFLPAFLETYDRFDPVWW
jgi:hypothetical protein